VTANDGKFAISLRVTDINLQSRVSDLSVRGVHGVVGFRLSARLDINHYYMFRRIRLLLTLHCTRVDATYILHASLADKHLSLPKCCSADLREVGQNRVRASRALHACKEHEVVIDARSQNMAHTTRN
jgi:hypothetical protein